MRNQRKIRRIATALQKIAFRTAPFSLLVVFTEAPTWIQATGWAAAIIGLGTLGLAALIGQEL